MTARAFMNHRCNFDRDLTPNSDVRSFQPNATAAVVPCRLWASAGKEAVAGEKTVVVEDLRAIVPLGTDVTLLDQIHGVTDRRGTVIDARALEVQTILARRDHLELVLQVVSV